ncbi:MAG: DNA translocase FtsK [Eubacterium sp.]
MTDKEVSDVVEYIIEKNGQVSYNADIEEKVKSQESLMGGGSGFTNSASDRDAYFEEAGKFIIEKEKGSIGMLQRMFKIGFNRAARIMDQLEEAGVVGTGRGYKTAPGIDDTGRI